MGRRILKAQEPDGPDRAVGRGLDPLGEAPGWVLLPLENPEQMGVVAPKLALEGSDVGDKRAEVGHGPSMGLLPIPRKPQLYSFPHHIELFCA